MGTDAEVGFADDGEGPARRVTVDPFHVDRYAVTNVEFLQFVRDEGYTTDAEQYGWSYVFEGFETDRANELSIGSAAGAPWWLAVEGANWLHPYGPGFSLLDDEDLLKHPVTHVSWNDARAYSRWAGKRLLTEAEWEFAARGGTRGTQFPWGAELTLDGEHRCNVWQGNFPEENEEADGYSGTAPVDAFRPNGYGLYNVIGNVWEWCFDRFSADHHATTSDGDHNPTGPARGRERVMKGGSYLCHDSWCNRYRIPARSKNTPDSSAGNIGFRCARDVDDC